MYNSQQDQRAADKTFIDRVVVFERLAPIIDVSLGDCFRLIYDQIGDYEAVVHNGEVAQIEPIKGKLFPFKCTCSGQAYDATDETAPAADKQVLARLNISSPQPPEFEFVLDLPVVLRESFLHEVIVSGKSTHKAMAEDDESHDKLETAWCRVQDSTRNWDEDEFNRELNPLPSELLVTVQLLVARRHVGLHDSFPSIVVDVVFGRGWDGYSHHEYRRTELLRAADLHLKEVQGRPLVVTRRILWNDRLAVQS